MEIDGILSQQRQFFRTQKTKDISFRISNLKKLKQLISDNESRFYEAIYKDFGKSKFDTFTTELSFIYTEIDYFIKNVRRLSQPKSVKTNLPNLPGSSKIYQDPLGNILVIGAWNYPIQLSLLPAIGALAAGNTCILKPSELAFHTSNLIAELINTNFPSNYFYIYEGGIEETTKVLNLRFDKIFFTGSPKVGKIVYEAAAKNLTPVTLELGGKSPAIVTKSANIKVAVKRIAWGKFINAGQTCVAPDYILVDESIKTEFLKQLKNQLKITNYQPESDYYTRIINEKNFIRLKNLIPADKIYFGGKTDASKLYIEPCILTDINWNDAIMQEEIFGPILPVLTYKTIDEALEKIQNFEKALSAYLFTSESEDIDKFTSQISFGGGCINDVVMHLSNDNLPFGGVGNSGIGNYHAKSSFDCFSHPKSILKRATWGEPNIKYPPYSEEKLKWIQKLL